jgi:hypothetical protein
VFCLKPSRFKSILLFAFPCFSTRSTEGGSVSHFPVTPRPGSRSALGPARMGLSNGNDPGREVRSEERGRPLPGEVQSGRECVLVYKAV